MDFEQEFTGQLIGIRPQSMTDRETGEEVRYFEVDVIRSADDGRHAEKLTCGERAFNGDDYQEWKSGQKVVCLVRPKRQGKYGIGAKLVRISSA